MNIKYKLLDHQKKFLKSDSAFTVMLCGRGAGKTYSASLLAAIKLLEEKRIVIFAQNFKALSENLMQEIVNRLNEIIPGKFNYNRGSQKITYKNGAIFGFSYENIEACRGFTDISVSILDEIALSPKALLPTLTFCMRGENIEPRIYGMTTPRAGSWFNVFVQNNTDINIIRATTKDNKFISAEQLDLMAKTCLDENMLRQEMYGELVDDNNSGILFSIKDLSIQYESYNTNIWSVGGDLSGFGKDNNSLVLRIGNKIQELFETPIANGNTLFLKIYEWVQRYGIENCSGIFLDQAYCEKLYEKCMERQWPVYAIPFGGKADDDVYVNKRAEMYFKLSNFVKENTIIGLTDKMKEELQYTRYILNDKNRIAIIPKEEIKEIIGRSPDSSDALALTFAMEDIPRGINKRKLLNQTRFMGD